MTDAQGQTRTEGPSTQAASPWPVEFGSGAFTSDASAASSPYRLFASLAHAGRTGLLRLEYKEGWYAIAFRRGVPEGAVSSRAEESFGEYLVATRALSRERLEEMSAAAGADLLVALISSQALDLPTALGHVANHARILIGRALRQHEGRYGFESEGKLAGAGGAQLGDRWGVLADAVRQLGLDSLSRRLGAYIWHRTLQGTGPLTASQMKLTAQEARAASMLEKGECLFTIYRGAGLDPHVLLRTAFLLWQTGILAFGERAEEAVQQARAGTPVPQNTQSTPPPPGPAQSSKTPPPPAQPRLPTSSPTAILRAQTVMGASSKPKLPQSEGELKAFLVELPTKNHFEVLGLVRTATPARIKVAYFERAKFYHPDRIPLGASEELRRLMTDVFSAIGAAWHVLGHDKRRAAYLEELDCGGTGGRNTADVLSILASEDHFRKGCHLAEARRFQDALVELEQAVKLNPREGEFLAWRAYVSFMTARDVTAAKRETLDSFEESFKLSPRCAQSYLLHGRVLRALGDPAGAQRAYKKALELEPKHAEAQAELKRLTDKR